MLFYFTMTLYNVWVLTNWIESEGRTVCGGAYVRLPIVMHRVMEAFREACAWMILANAVSELFFAEAVK